MARRRNHNSRSRIGNPGNTGASWISYSDLMCALLLVFVLILSVSLHQYFTMLETKTAELDEQKSLISLQQVQLDEQTLQLASQQVTMDHQNAQIVIIQSQLDEKENELNSMALDLAEQKNQIIIIQGQLDEKEAELNTMAGDLANKEISLEAAIAALDAQTQKIEAMVGVKSKIILDLSASLSRANLNATVDQNTGDIVLDSSVLFKTNSSDIQADGRYLLDRFIPVYLEVLLRPEYADYLGEIIIEGHTDDIGTYVNNLKLSQDRALKVAEYVLGMYPEGTQKRAMLEKILTATGRSESDPVYYPGTNTINQDASRRVEFKFSLKDAEMIDEMNRLLQGN